MFRRFGVALGTLIPKGGQFLISADSTVADPFMDGLHFSGAAVIDLGLLPGPMVYYAARRINADGLAMITGVGSVGIQWLIGDTVPNSNQVETLKNLLSRNDSFPVPKPKSFEPRFLDVSNDYVAWLQNTWFDSPGKKMHVVLETCGGPWTGRARRFLQAVFPQIVFSEVSDEHDPFRAIAKEVDLTRAEPGFILGPDGGQITAVDGYGIPYTTEELNRLLLESFGASLHGEIFLHDAQCPPSVLAKATGFGATAQEVPADDASFRRAMAETSAIFGADSAGHHYFRAICGINDALFTACWLLDYLAHSDRTLAQCR